jgi:hypothetical protein
VNIQQIIERLLRARLYSREVVIRTDAGVSHGVLVHEVRYEGSRSFVVVSEKEHRDSVFCIPLTRITHVAPEPEPEPAAR